MIRLLRPQCPDPEALRSNYKVPLNKEVLVEASHGKCMYCESRVTDVYFGDVEHIRPKDQFPNLEFEWTNLGFVCAKCNNSKRNKWFDDTPFIDPYSEEPSEAIVALGQWLFSVPGSDRGRVTLHEIELNRPNLLQNRLEKLNHIQELLDLRERATNNAVRNALSSRLEEELGPEAEYRFIGHSAYEKFVT